MKPSQIFAGQTVFKRNGVAFDKGQVIRKAGFDTFVVNFGDFTGRCSAGTLFSKGDLHNISIVK